MRDWANPKHFYAPDGKHLVAYRVRAVAPNGMNLPTGCYVAIRMEDGEQDLRIIVGPFDPDEAHQLLDRAGPHDLVDLLHQATRKPSPNDTVH